MKRFVLFTAFAVALGLGGCTRNDDAISANVRQQLSQARMPATISVSTSDGVVTLAGTVPDTGAKQQAEQVAIAVGGVRHVVNDLHPTMAGDAPPHPNIAPAPPAAAPPPPQAPNIPPNPANPPPGAPSE